MGFIAFHGLDLFFWYRDSYLTNSSDSAFLMIFRWGCSWVGRKLTKSWDSFLPDWILSVFLSGGSCKIRKFDFTEFIQFIGLSLSVWFYVYFCTFRLHELSAFCFSVYASVLFCSVHGTHTFLNKFCRVIILRNLWTHSFRIDLSMWGFLEIISLFRIFLMSFFCFRSFPVFVACTKQDASSLSDTLFCISNVFCRGDCRFYICFLLTSDSVMSFYSFGVSFSHL